jgi:F-type H+-transporting ATPase subunit epsilon
MAASDTIRCTIVTPEKAVFDEDVSYVSFPAWDGQHGMMAGTSPLLTRLGVGTARIDLADGNSVSYLLDGGFAQVEPKALTLLTEAAWLADEVSTDTADADLRAANERVTKPGEDRTKVEHDQQLAMAKRALAGKK